MKQVISASQRGMPATSEAQQRTERYWGLSLAAPRGFSLRHATGSGYEWRDELGRYANSTTEALGTPGSENGCENTDENQWVTARPGCYPLHASWFLGLLLNSEEGGDVLVGSICWLSTDYTASYYRKYNSSVAWVRERTIRTERSPLVGEVSANFYE
jgi:hypothetical protein